MKSLFSKNLLRTSLILILALAGFGFYYYQAQAAIVTWDGGGADNNWNTCANWSGDTCPTSADIATFDATSTKNATINVAINVAGIDINSGYTGTITQSSTCTPACTVTIGASNYDQAAGTFTGGDANIDINNGSFTLSSGAFTNSSGGLNVEINITVSGGTFTNTGKTVTIDGADGTDDTIISCNTTSAIGGTVVVSKSGNVAATTTIGEGVNDCSLDFGTNPTTTLANNSTADLTVTAGSTITASGSWTVKCTITNCANGLSIVNDGTITHNGTGWDFNDTGLENNSGATITFNGTSLTIEQNFTQSGTFSLTGKTVTLDGSEGNDDSTVTCGTLGGTLVITKSGAVSAFVTIAASCSVSLGASPTTTLANNAGADLTINGTITIDSGTWTVQNTTVNGTTMDIIVGSGGTITHNGNGWDINDAGFIINSGGTATYSGTSITVERNFSQDGTLTATGLTVTLDGAGGADDTNLSCTGTLTGNLTINKIILGTTTVLTGNCTVTGDFTRTDGPVQNPTAAFTLSIQGNFSSSTTDDFGGANMTVEFSGSSSQTITQNAIPTTNTSLFVVNKTSNTVTLATAVTLDSTLTITAGTLNQGATFNLTINGATTVSSGGSLTNTGTGDLLLAGNVSNSGTITMNGGGTTCGDADSILIDSTVNGTQRAWSGAGTFTLIDVTVNDMAGTATVFVYNGTNNGNNGANWVFRSECPEGDPGTLRNIRIRGGVKVRGGVKAK